MKKSLCTSEATALSGVSGECSLPPATGEHCLLAMPLRERVRPVVSGDAMPTEPQSGAMAPRFGWGGALKRSSRACYNADYLGMGPRAGGGAGIINYQPGPAGQLAGRGGTTLT